jgi:hypothetical protein
MADETPAGTAPAAPETPAAPVAAATPGTPPAAAPKTPADPSAQKPAGTDGAPSETPKAPEKYTLTLPAGGYVDDTDRATIEAFARTNNLTNDEAQLYVTRVAEARAADSARFLAETTADPTYGGEKLAETQQLARAALEKLRPAGTPRGDAIRALLDKSGYGNHVEVISLLADLGKSLQEDRPVTPGGGIATKDPAAVLYGSS